MASTDATPHPKSSAFLLAQVGAHAARRFAERLEQLDLTPAIAGALRLVAKTPAINQRTLARQLGSAPSRVVALVDEMEARGLIIRQRGQHDRRVQELDLTPAGHRLMGEISLIATDHDEEFTAALSDLERDDLRRLLIKLVDAADLTPGVHPGHRAHRHGET